MIESTFKFIKTGWMSCIGNTATPDQNNLVKVNPEMEILKHDDSIQKVTTQKKNKMTSEYLRD